MESSITRTNNTNSNTENTYNKIINLLQIYIYTHNPLFSESFNDVYHPITDTYIIEIKSRVRPRVIEVLNMLQFRTGAMAISDYDKEIRRLPRRCSAAKRNS